MPTPVLPDAGALARAREFGMPPLDRGRFAADPVLEATLDALPLARRGDRHAASRGRGARADCRCAPTVRATMMPRPCSTISIPVEALAEHAFVAAALQVHFARLAGAPRRRRRWCRSARRLPGLRQPPDASMVVGWLGAHGARYCGCSLCGTLWNYVRIKCTLCGSTKGIGYREIEGGPGTVKAETCSECRGYVKILQQDKDPPLESSPTTWRASARPADARRPASGAAASIRSCLDIEARRAA